MDAEMRASVVADSHQSVEQRIGGRIPALAPAVSCPGKGRSLTPDFVPLSEYHALADGIVRHAAEADCK